MFTAALVGATLLWCTPLFEHMPLNALGAIVIASVIGLVQYEECKFLWKVPPDTPPPSRRTLTSWHRLGCDVSDYCHVVWIGQNFACLVGYMNIAMEQR